MRTSTTLALSFALASLALACGNGDSIVTGPSLSSGPSLSAFDGSPCKKESTVRSGSVQQALSADDVYAGLQCVRWAPVDGGFRVVLLNFEGACGAEWTGQVGANDGAVALRLVNPLCLVAACGWCIYDWTFDVRMGASPGGNAFDIVVDTCPGTQQPESESVVLPLDTQPTGELCRYANANALGWQAMALDTCGAAYMPCREEPGMCGTSAGAAPCDADLVCADGADAAAHVCQSACAADSDCTPKGVMKCEASVCRPAHPW